MATSSEWRRRSTIAGWVLLPLRLFLGVTYLFAGLQKFADPTYFHNGAPSSVQSQLRLYQVGSPVRALLASSSHHAVLVGLLIAFGEIAVGIGTLLGLWTRVAAAGGMALALAFLMSVSWHTHPYYLGPDIVFLFAFIPLLLAGASDVWSLDGWLQREGRVALGLSPAGVVNIEFATVRRVCGHFDSGRCRAQQGRRCQPEGCPVLLAAPAREDAARAVDLDRRVFLAQARLAGILGAGALIGGGITAGIGRLLHGSTSSTSTPRLGAGQSSPVTIRSHRSTSTTTSGAPTSGPAASRPSGTAVGAAASVAVHGAALFTDPATGEPAIVVQATPGQFKAFSALCTHRGCTVDYQGGELVCPCHGARFDASTGAVTQGPAQQPLAPVSVQKGSDGQLYVT